MHFWIPNLKYQLVDELCKVYPGDRFKFKDMSKRQLIAIFCRLREKQLGITDLGEDNS